MRLVDYSLEQDLEVNVGNNCTQRGYVRHTRYLVYNNDDNQYGVPTEGYESGCLGHCWQGEWPCSLIGSSSNSSDKIGSLQPYQSQPSSGSCRLDNFRSPERDRLLESYYCCVR